MPEEVTDGLERGSFLQKTNRQGMAQTRWTMEGNIETTFLSPVMKSFPDSRVFQHIDRGIHSQKDPSMWPWWWSSPQMLHQRAGDFLGKRQFQR